MDAPEVGEAGRAAVDLAEASVVDDEEDGRRRTGHELGLHGARLNGTVVACALWLMSKRGAAILLVSICTYRRNTTIVRLKI